MSKEKLNGLSANANKKRLKFSSLIGPQIKGHKENIKRWQKTFTARLLNVIHIYFINT